MRAQLNEMTGITVKVEEATLLTLVGHDRDAAMGGIVAGRKLPFVIVEGVLACSGALDPEESPTLSWAVLVVRDPADPDSGFPVVHHGRSASWRMLFEMFDCRHTTQHGSFYPCQLVFVSD